MSFTDVNEHTKKIISNKQYKSMGKIPFTTPEKLSLNLEKTFSMESTGSVLNTTKKTMQTDIGSNLGSVAKEIESIKESIKNRDERTSAEKTEPLKIIENQIAVKDIECINVPEISVEAVQTINALVHAQNFIVQELTDAFEKKFEKFDEIILELIRCKTENERLKHKVDNMTRDNYKLKKETESYKSLVPGLYVKRDVDKTKF